MPPTHIMVTSAPGRLTPIHKDDGQEPGGGLLHADDKTVIRVKYSQAIRRSITRGDLIPCNLDGVSCAVERAAAKDELPEPRLAKKGTPK
jgi:hypothetical protein